MFYYVGWEQRLGWVRWLLHASQRAALHSWPENAKVQGLEALRVIWSKRQGCDGSSRDWSQWAFNTGPRGAGSLMCFYLEVYRLVPFSETTSQWPESIQPLLGPLPSHHCLGSDILLLSKSGTSDLLRTVRCSWMGSEPRPDYGFCGWVGLLHSTFIVK